jgi:hypothetical protein
MSRGDDAMAAVSYPTLSALAFQTALWKQSYSIHPRGDVLKPKIGHLNIMRASRSTQNVKHVYNPEYTSGS